MVTRALRRLLPAGIASSLAPPVASAQAGDSAPSTAGSDDPPDSLDVCLLSYRSNPYSGGQGVYVKHLSRALVDLGHSVDVISGHPTPDLDPEVTLIELPGENVVEADDRLRAFEPGYLRDPTKLFEWASVLTGGFPEPYTFGRRVVEYFEAHDPDYDVVHDNQCLAYGLLDLLERGEPVVATVHHPITVDRDMDLRHAQDRLERLLVRRWYRFLGMQRSVAGELPHLVTVSESAKRRTVADFDVAPESVEVVHNGIDADLFSPRDVETRPDRLVTTVSADMPLKGARYLLEAFAEVRERANGDPELVVVGEFDEGGTAERLVDDLGIAEAVTTRSGISDAALVELYSSAAVAVVPSLYEGFGLPAGEAMACGTPVVATRGGGLPEVVGDAGVLVPTGDAGALADAVCDLLGNPDRRRRLGEQGRERVVSEFDWETAARETVEEYRRAIAHADG